MYYNTTKESGTQLELYRNNAKTQDNRILLHMQGNQRKAYGASDLSKVFPNMLLTSIRRSLNTLERKGLICKTGKKQPGLFQNPENTYRYD